MRAPSQVSWATLLLCCTAVSLTTSIAVALAYHQFQTASKRESNREKGGRTATNGASKGHTAGDAKASDDSSTTAVKEEARGHAEGPLASLEALLSSVEELLAKEGKSKEAPQPEAETDILFGLNDAPSPSQEPHLSTKALLASVEEILARDEKMKAVEAKPREELDADPVEKEEVPEEMRVDKYFSPDHIKAFDHSDVFRGHNNVSAVIDAIRPYLEKFFREGAWAAAHPQADNATILKPGRRINGRFVGDSGDSDTDEDDGESVASMDASMTSQWRLPECIDPTESTDVVLYPGVDSRTFSPEKIINLDSSTPNMPARGEAVQVTHRQPQKKHIVVLPGAMILGGVFDVSEGSIFIGKHARIEHNAYIKGPCIIGDHSTVRSGAYLGGDLIIGNHVLLRGELKNALIMDHTELRHPGYYGDSICGVNRRVLGPQELESHA